MCKVVMSAVLFAYLLMARTDGAGRMPHYATVFWRDEAGWLFWDEAGWLTRRI
jgi:hypothetical protein